MSEKFHMPRRNESGLDALWRWYANVPLELEAGSLTTEEKRYFSDYYEEAGLLTRWRQPFFRQHYARTFAAASAFLLGAAEKPTILDLGCGSGTQSLYFALMGARVIGVDLDTAALEIMKKRVKFYGELAGRELDVQVFCSDTIAFDYASVAPIDGVFSLFAFNMMQPSAALLQALMPHLSRKARLAVLDGNNRSWLPRLYPPRRRNVWSPEDFRNNLENLRFMVSCHHGGISLPPAFWMLPGQPLLERLDGLLNRNWFFPVSHLIMAERLG